MIYTVLKAYREYLLQFLGCQTAETYYKRLCLLFEGQSITDTVGKLDIQKIITKLGDIRHKNYFSQSKNAFIHFCEYQNIKLSEDVLAAIRELESATKKKYRRLKTVEYSQIDNKIKHLRNLKLKLSFQTMLATGLRVSELSGLSVKDCTITPDSVLFGFIGKGGQAGTVMVKTSDFPKLYQRLKELIETTPADKKLFYSAGYLQGKARELGFACHDLRRSYAKLEYQKCRSKVEVSQKLRHSNVRTTNIYLRSKVRI